jgi:hypothetical protein
MLLVNPSTALEIVDRCSREGVGSTRTDSRIFRMSRTPLLKCGW